MHAKGSRSPPPYENLMSDEAVVLTLGSGCEYRLSLAERRDCTETVMNQLLADAYENSQ